MTFTFSGIESNLWSETAVVTDFSLLQLVQFQLTTVILNFLVYTNKYKVPVILNRLYETKHIKNYLHCIDEFWMTILFVIPLLNSPFWSILFFFLRPLCSLLPFSLQRIFVFESQAAWRFISFNIYYSSLNNYYF